MRPTRTLAILHGATPSRRGLGGLVAVVTLLAAGAGSASGAQGRPATMSEGPFVTPLAIDEMSATTSFFVALAPTPGLDGKYTVFGEVESGLDVVAAIEQVPLDGEAPRTRVELRRVRLERVKGAGGPDAAAVGASPGRSPHR